MTLRLSETAARSIATSRMAASGGTRPERMAGATAHTSVTMVPTTTVMTNGDELSTRSVSPGPNPAALRPARMADASPTPPRQPSNEPPMPTTRASTNSDRVTCARLAPMARSSAFSRSRWAALMLNTL